MGAWDFLALSAGGNLHAHKSHRFWFFFGGGGSANFIFTGAGIFLKNQNHGFSFWFSTSLFLPLSKEKWFEFRQKVVLVFGFSSCLTEGDRVFVASSDL